MPLFKSVQIADQIQSRPLPNPRLAECRRALIVLRKLKKAPRQWLGPAGCIYDNRAVVRFTILRPGPIVCRSPKFEIVNASSFPHVTGRRNLPVRRSGRNGHAKEPPISSLENSGLLRVARVGNRMTSILWLMLLAIISLLYQAGCC
jgi:hypothetical protein